MQLLRGEHLGRVVRLPHPRLGCPVELVHFEVDATLAKVPIVANVKARHFFCLIVGGERLGLLRAPVLQKLSSVTLEGGERQGPVAVLCVGTVLPDELRRGTVGVCG